MVELFWVCHLKEEPGISENVQNMTFQLNTMKEFVKIIFG